MKFKKIMLVTLVLLAVLMIGAASASQDINTNETLAVEDIGEVSIDASFDDEIITGSSDTEKIGAALEDDALGDDNFTEGNDGNDYFGNGTTVSGNTTAGNDTENGGDENIDDMVLWVNTEDEFSTAPEDLPAIFACVTVPEGTQGNVTFTCNDRILYNLALSDFIDGRIDRENNRYNIALEVDGEFIFEGCDDGDCIRFAFLDENGDEIACNEYLIFFGDNTVRFELNAHNPGDHVSIDVSGEVNINDGDDFVFINLPSDVTEGSVVVVSGNFTLFEESVNFNEGTHWWKEIDNHYVCSFSPNSLTNWDKLSTGDIVTFAFLDGDGQVVESRDYTVTVEDDNVRFDESQQIEVNIWNSDENGILYTDLDYSDIVSVNVPPNCYGTISVLVNGEERDSWGIEHEDDGWAHNEWGLFDLGIFGEGNYNVTVKLDDEILTESMLQVVKDNKDKFRPVFILDMIRLYCPANVTGNVIISFEGQDDMGNTYPACSDFTYEIAPEESGTWIEWTTEDLGIDLDTYYRVTVNVEDDAGETLYNLTRWHEFVLYPEYESRIWYRTSTEIIDHDYFSWELYNRIGYYHKWGKRSIVSIYINDDDWNALPDYVFDYTDYPTGCYHISLDDIGINSVGEYYIRADYQWGDEEDGCDAYITVYEPQEASGIVDHDIAGDHYLTIEILPVRKIISGNTWDDYVIEFKGEFENYMGLGSTIEIAFENGTRVVLDLEDVFRHNGKLGSEELKINKEGEYYITVTVTGNVNQRIVKCSGIIRYLSPVQVELDMANLRTDKLYIGYGLDDNTYIALWPRDNFCELNDIEGNVSVYINGKLDKTFNIKQLPIVGDQPDNMNYFIPLSLLSDIPVGNNTITVIYEGNEPSVEKTQNFTAVMLTADKFFEYATINIDEDVYSDQVTPVKIYFSGNPMSADPLIWGKLVLYVNGERINRTVVVIYEDDEIQGIYDETDPEAIELINRIHTSNPEGLYYDRFDWLNLAFLHWHCDDGLKYLSLDDLNITSEGVYNITLNYFGYDDVWDANSGYVGRGSELRLISQNMNYTTDNTHMKVVITPENKYTVNTPSLINFELGEDYWNPSTERTYNNVVVYINNTLAFNDTLVRYTYGDWDAQIKIFGGASSNCISRDLLNEFDCLDEGNYHADVYMENDGKLTGIASGDFSVIKQRGDMSFSIDSSVDLGEHAFLYADIPQSLVEDYELVLRIRVDDEDIDVDVGKITGQGEVPVDLGVLRKGAHVVYVELAPDTNNWDDFYNVSKNFYNNYFKVNVIGNNATVTPETFGDFFDENGVLTSDADDLIFEGVFNNVTMTINHPVSLIGNGATFNDVSIIVESDDVSIENLEFIFTASEDADSYAVLVSGVSNFGMVNNTVVYVGKTKGEGINNAVRITDSSSVVLRNNNFMISLVSAAGSWAEDPVGSGNWVTHTVSEGIVVSDSRDIDFEDNVVIISYNNVSGSFDEIYGVSFRNSDNARVTGNVISARGHTYVYAVYVSGNEFGIYDNEIDAESDVNYACAINVEGPASGIIENNNVHAKAPTSVYAILSSMGDVGVSYTSNEITAEGYFIFGIYDDSEEIIGNTITLTGNYTVGIVVLSDATVENNKITLIASNVGSESVWETVPMETSGIVVRADAAILNNEISSNHKSISILGGSSTITDNTLIGYVHVASNDNTFTGNMINTTGEYAVDLGSSTGNVITENELYANELEGDSAVNGDKLANEIYGNYPSNLTDAVLVVEAYDIAEGENVTIEVTLPSDAEGMVTLTVDGMNFNSNVIDGKAVFNFADLSVGSYEVLASYSGDAKYRATQNTTEFTVNPSSASESRLVIAVDDITYGENLTITVSTVDGVDCNVSLFFDGAVTNIQLVGGTGSATFSNVNAGRYVVKADIKSGESIVDSVNTTVKVNRADSVLNVSDVEFEWNANGTAVVSYTGATGVKANVVNQTAVIDVVNGTITISGLNPGTYTLNVTTIVDDNHNPVTETSSIKVSKAASSVAVDVESQFNVGDEITITVTNSTACVVTVNNIACDVINGKVIIDSAELGEGTYEVIATIAEDDLFKGSSANATFKVSLIDTAISVENATLELLVGENRTIGAVTVPEGLKVDFTTGNSSVVSVDENGNVVAVGAGSAIIYLSVGDNVAYKYSQATVNVTVRKIPTQIILERDSFDLYAKNYIEDFASLNPADAGNLTFVSSDNSVVSIVYDAIFANGTGTATVTVSFAGNDKYAAAESKTITVTVSLKDSSVSVENDTLDLNVDDRYDLNATTVPGFLPVEYVSSNVSVATVTDYGIVTAVGEGTAIITLTVGNGETYAVNSTSVTVKVSKLPSEIITVSDALDLVAGDEVSSPASLSPSAAGDLAYVISNEDVVKIVNGNIVAVGSGNATVTYSFAGNDKYAAAESKTITVTVSKAKVPIDNDSFNFDENKTVESKTPSYSINLPSDATGNLTVIIGDKTYTAEVVNGTATIVVNDLPAGDYNVTVAYSGDGKYSAIVKTSKAKVKVDPRIVASDLTVQHTAGKYYSVTVYGDNGKVASGVLVTFYLKGKKVTTTRTDAKGIAKFLVTQTPMSKAQVKAVALGKTVTKKLTIKRVVSIKSISVKRTSKKIVLKATLAKVNGKYLVGKKITFKFNGKTFKAVKTKSRGVATLTLTPKKYNAVFKKLSKTKKGKKITYSATYSGDTVKKTVKIK